MLNGSAYSVAGLNGTNTTWRAGENHITGMQLKQFGQFADDFWHTPNHFENIGVLALNLIYV